MFFAMTVTERGAPVQALYGKAEDTTDKYPRRKWRGGRPLKHFKLNFEWDRAMHLNISYGGILRLFYFKNKIN